MYEYLQRWSYTRKLVSRPCQTHLVLIFKKNNVSSLTGFFFSLNLFSQMQISACHTLHRLLFQNVFFPVQLGQNDFSITRSMVCFKGLGANLLNVGKSLGLSSVSARDLWPRERVYPFLVCIISQTTTSSFLGQKSGSLSNPPPFPPVSPPGS